MGMSTPLCHTKDIQAGRTPSAGSLGHTLEASSLSSPWTHLNGRPWWTLAGQASSHSTPLIPCEQIRSSPLTAKRTACPILTHPDSPHNNNLPRRRGTEPNFWQLISLRYSRFLPGIATTAAMGVKQYWAALVGAGLSAAAGVTFIPHKGGWLCWESRGEKQKNWQHKKCSGEKWGQQGVVWYYNETTAAEEGAGYHQQRHTCSHCPPLR